VESANPGLIRPPLVHLAAMIAGALAAAGTALPGGLPTTAIVQTGPYRRSRNPIYVAFALIHAGTGLCLDSMWILATLAPAFLLIA
jgi:protein-S-isoprenylcysteine O-methyltransferase Ste14